MSFLTIGSKRKNRNKNIQYHSIFISFESQVYSRQESLFFLFGSWSLVLYLHAWQSQSFFQSNLTILGDAQCLHENDI